MCEPRVEHTNDSRGVPGAITLARRGNFERKAPTMITSVELHPEVQALLEQTLSSFPGENRPSPEIVINRAILNGLRSLKWQIRDANELLGMAETPS